MATKAIAQMNCEDTSCLTKIVGSVNKAPELKYSPSSVPQKLHIISKLFSKSSGFCGKFIFFIQDFQHLSSDIFFSFFK